MEYICTTCCMDKREDEELLPATERYISERIDFVAEESSKLGKPFIILSGKYGMIDADHEIPWYDKALVHEDVASMVPIVKSQLLEKGVWKIKFYGKPRTTPGWEPYYALLEQSCAQLGIPITYQEVNLE